MSAINQRLGRLLPALTAQERAILILRSLKYGTPEQPGLNRSSHFADVREMNHYIGLMNLANIQLAAFITVVELQTKTLEHRFAGLVALQLWQEEREVTQALVWQTLKRPITQSEYDQRAAAAANDFTPVADLAWVLANETDWTEDDLEVLPNFGAPVVKDSVFQRVCADQEAELRVLATTGALVARGKSASLAIENASFYAWLGRPVPAWPEWPGCYEVLPDDQAIGVRYANAYIDKLQEVLERSIMDGHAGQGPGKGLQWLIERLLDRLAEGIERGWLDVLGADYLLDRIAAGFNGEDPLKPVTREALEKTRQSLRKLRDDLEVVGRNVTLPLMDNNTLAAMDELAKKSMKTYS